MTTVTIVRRYDFEAAHFLPNVPDGHKCKTMHGHSYVVEVHVTGHVQESGSEAGMVMDFGVLDAAWAGWKEKHDHRPLNDLYPNPTVEVMAPELFRHFNHRSGITHDVRFRVHFFEGPRSACIFPPYSGGHAP